MSIYEYRPNGENTLPIYPIGTEGLEHAIKKDTTLSFVANIVSALYPYAKIPAALAIGLLDWDANSLVPTYGKWAGPGWGGGARKMPSEETWTVAPCYNQSVIGSSNPESCYSLVDAICKTHDWNYYQAEQQFKIDQDSLKYETAIMTADIELLKSIANALVYHTYTSPTGEYNNGTWTPKTYGGTFDTAESLYVAKLVPLFIAKIAIVDTTIEARSAIATILSNMQTNFDGIIVKDNLFIQQNEKEKRGQVFAWLLAHNSSCRCSA